MTTAQLAFAWVLSRGEDIIPLIGTKRRDRLREALGALDITLTPDEVTAIEPRSRPARSPATATTPPMAALDSGSSWGSLLRISRSSAPTRRG